MVDKSIQEQIVREAPEIEAIKLGLLESSKKLADMPVNLPKYEVAGLSDLQHRALLPVLLLRVVSEDIRTT